jgi:hypothetical protein
MFLIPPDALKDNINDYYTTYGNDRGQLIGYFPCSNTEDIWCSYYTVLSKDKLQRFAPVFYVSDMLFDSEPNDAVPGPALFFMGCDDGHMGMKFVSKEEALDWIKWCPYVDFNVLYQAYSERKINLYFHN